MVADLKPSTQAPDPSQESAPSHAPPLEVPTQGVVAVWKLFAGQTPDVPVQLSATSHSPADARQIEVAARKPSTQWPAPSQESDPSHAPPFDVPTHVVVEGRKPSAGQALDEPEQLSATSHEPAAMRHTVPAMAMTSDGQLLLAPLQVSAMSHPPATPRQTVPAVAMTSAGHDALVPVHCSAASHKSVAARQTVDAGAKLLAGHRPLASQVSAGSQRPADARHTVVVATGV